MNLLIIGGGVFLGQALLSTALENGHTVTVFNRGLTRQWWPPGVKWIVGDRTEDLHLLMNRSWDAVIDTCGYRPQDVEASCAALFDSCDRYVYISSVSAYASFAKLPIRESDPLASIGGIDTEAVTGSNYGPMKTEGESTVPPGVARVWRGLAPRATRTDRRTGRPDRTLFLLAVAHCRRGAHAGPRQARAVDPVHRCTRPCHLDPAPDYAAPRWCIQRHRTQRGRDDGRIDRHLPLDLRRGSRSR